MATPGPSFIFSGLGWSGKRRARGAPAQARAAAAAGNDAGPGGLAPCLARRPGGARPDRDHGRCDRGDLLGVPDRGGGHGLDLPGAEGGVRSERAFGTLQDRLVNELALAGITDIAAANAFLRDVYLPAHNARFAVLPAGEGSAFTPIPGVDLDEILCVEEERQGGHDNCVSYRTLKLQIPQSPMRPHFVKARVKVHLYADGSHAVFHGPRCIGRYDEKGALRQPDETKNAA